MLLSFALRRAAAAAVLFAGSSPLCLMGNSYNDSFVARVGAEGVSGLKLTTKKTQTIRNALSSIFRGRGFIRARINPTDGPIPKKRYTESDKSTESTEPVAVTESVAVTVTIESGLITESVDDEKLNRSQLMIKRWWWKLRLVNLMMKTGFFESNDKNCKACLAQPMLPVSFGEHELKSFVNSMFSIILTYVKKYRSSTTHSESSNVESEDWIALYQDVNVFVQGLLGAYSDEEELVNAFYAGEVKLIVDLVLTRKIFTSIEEWKTAIEFLYFSKSTPELRAAYGASEIDAPWVNLKDVGTVRESLYASFVRNIFELIKHWKDEGKENLSVDKWTGLVRALEEDISWSARVDLDIVSLLKARIARCRNEANDEHKAEELTDEDRADLIEVKDVKCGSDEWVDNLILNRTYSPARLVSPWVNRHRGG